MQLEVTADLSADAVETRVRAGPPLHRRAPPNPCRRLSLRDVFPSGRRTGRRSRAPGLSRDEIRAAPAWVAGTAFFSD